jgi:hypothetical protein
VEVEAKDVEVEETTDSKALALVAKVPNAVSTTLRSLRRSFTRLYQLRVASARLFAVAYASMARRPFNVSMPVCTAVILWR